MNLEEELRHDWEYVNKTNPESVKDFFELYMCLSCVDIATAINSSESQMQKYRKFAGITDSSNYHGIGTDIPIFPRELEEGFIEYVDTKEWWESNYEKYGYRVLSHITGKTIRSVKYHIARLDIPLKGQRNLSKRNKYNNIDILTDLYVNRNFTAKSIAELAGVCRRTVKLWLTKLNIKKHRARTYVAKDFVEQDFEKE